MLMQHYASDRGRGAGTLGCIIKCAPLRARCQHCANRGGRPGERHWHRKDFPHWRKAFYVSHSDSLWMRWIILSTQCAALPKHCELLSNYDFIFFFLVDFQDFPVSVLLFDWKEEARSGWLYKRWSFTPLLLFYLIDPTRKATHAGT